MAELRDSSKCLIRLAFFLKYLVPWVVESKGSLGRLCSTSYKGPNLGLSRKNVQVQSGNLTDSRLRLLGGGKKWPHVMGSA